MTRSEAQTRQLFDKWASTYDTDLRHESGILMGYASSLRGFEHSVAAQCSGVGLDIGIGTGGLAERMEPHVSTVIGIDISQRMLDACRTKHPGYDLKQGSFNAIPLGDDSVDTVVSGFTFHEVATLSRYAAITEVGRVLKPGGLLCLLDIMFASTVAMEDARRLIREQWDDDEDYAIVSELDTLLRQHIFTPLQWHQTAPFHWMVTARKL